MFASNKNSCPQIYNGASFRQAARDVGLVCFALDVLDVSINKNKITCDNISNNIV